MSAVSQPQPLFIVCFSRTGSTLLRYILDTHTNIGCPPEFNIGHQAKQLQFAYEVVLDPEFYESKEERDQAIIKHLREHFDLLLSHYCKNVGKTWWCEKSVCTMDHLDLVRAIYPDAKFICLYRNCLDMVRSGLEVLQYYDSTGQRSGFDPFLQNALDAEAGLADFWVSKTEAVLNIEKKYPESCFRITYESVVEGRDSTFKALFDFIGLDWDPDILNNVFKVHHTRGHGDPKILETVFIHDNSIGLGKEVNRGNIGVDRIKAINKIHQRLGYEKVKLD